MDEFKDILDNIINLRGKCIEYSNKCLDKENALCIHINQLKDYMHDLEDGSQRELIGSTIDLLKREHAECIDFVKEISTLINDLDSLISLMNSEVNGIIDKSIGLRILEAQEEERRRIARELHDSTVQNLTGLVYKAELCSKILNVDSTRVNLELQIIIASLKEVIKELRSTIYNLKPTMVMDTNFNDRIKKYINNMGISYPNINFSFCYEGIYKPVNNIYCSVILLIIQEACQNAAKHSKASSISVKVDYLSDSLRVKISDNGKGFDLNKLETSNRSREHFGFMIMKERADLLGGNLKISSNINEGTIVQLELSRVYDSEGDNDGSN